MRYLKSAARTKQRADLLGSSNVTKFPGLENKQQLFCGDYTCNDKGVYRNDECICNHPIYISKLVQPIDDSGAAHIELSYYIDEKWQSIIRPRRAIYDRRQILGLSEIGLDVTSENAGDIIQYFRTLEGWSGCAPADGSEPRTIPKIDGFARFGWHDDKFMPYISEDQAVFTGAVEYENVFNAFERKGSFDEWKKAIRPFYEQGANPAVRTALAAATASIILGYIEGGLPFFVHFFGASGNGKTVTLKVAASMFGNPSAEGGGLIQSFSSTQVGLERRAEVLNNVPMLLDELGVKGGSTEHEVSELVYQLTEGVGKTRGAREGGIQKMAKWLCVFITTGEQTLTSLTSQAGVRNRVLSVDINGGEIFGNVREATAMIDTINSNYGYAAHMIIDNIITLGRDAVKAKQQNALKALKAKMQDGMNKQLVSASFMAVADEINRLSFLFSGIEINESYDWLTKIIATEDEVSALQNALDWIKGWRTTNGSHFFTKGSEVDSEVMGNSQDVWGIRRKDGYWAYVPMKLEEAMTRAGLKYTGIIAEAKAHNLLMTDSNGKSTVNCRIGVDKSQRCIVFKVKDEAAEPEQDEKKPLKILEWGSGVTSVTKV